MPTVFTLRACPSARWRRTATFEAAGATTVAALGEALRAELDVPRGVECELKLRRESPDEGWTYRLKPEPTGRAASTRLDALGLVPRWRFVVAGVNAPDTLLSVEVLAIDEREPPAAPTVVARTEEPPPPELTPALLASVREGIGLPRDAPPDALEQAMEDGLLQLRSTADLARAVELLAGLTETNAAHDALARAIGPGDTLAFFMNAAVEQLVSRGSVAEALAAAEAMARHAPEPSHMWTPLLHAFQLGRRDLVREALGRIEAVLRLDDVDTVIQTAACWMGLRDLARAEQLLRDCAAWPGLGPEQRARVREVLRDAMRVVGRSADAAAIDETLRAEQRQRQQAAAAAPGPNDPCPCGSGKKFKRCCGGS